MSYEDANLDFDTLGPGQSKAPRPSVLRATSHGARIGLKWTSWIGGILSGVFIIGGLALTAFGLGTGRGWGVAAMLPRAFAFFIACDAIGLFMGGIVGLLVRLLPERCPASTWSAANRPIRIFRFRREESKPIDNTPLPTRRRRWPWFIAVPVVLLLIVAFGVGIYCGRLVDQKLAAAIAAADRDDPF